MMDVSDGLLLDAPAHGRTSGCDFSIELATLPLSGVFIAEPGKGLDAAFSLDRRRRLCSARRAPAGRRSVNTLLTEATTIDCIGTLKAPRLGGLMNEGLR